MQQQVYISPTPGTNMVRVTCEHLVSSVTGEHDSHSLPRGGAHPVCWHSGKIRKGFIEMRKYGGKRFHSSLTNIVPHGIEANVTGYLARDWPFILLPVWYADCQTCKSL